MRKKYISPVTEEYRIQSTPLMVGSIIIKDDETAEVDIDPWEDYDGVFGSRSDSWGDD